MAPADVMRTLASRADMLIVYAVAGPAPAGLYSVARTVGDLVLYAPEALATGGFRAIALAPDAARQAQRTGEVSRTAVLAYLLISLPMAAAAPWLVPAVFGSGFRDALTPTLILLAAGLAGSLVAVLGRAATAIGHGAAHSLALATGLCIMLALDLALVPRAGTTGAALALGVGSVAAAAALLMLVRRRGLPLRAFDLWPQREDVRRTVDAACAARRQVRARGRT